MAEQAGGTGPIGARPGNPGRRRNDPVGEAVAASDQLMERLRLVDAGVMVGVFAGFDAQGQFLVRLARGLAPVVALSTVGLNADDEGDEVVLSLERGDPKRPVILGRAMRHAEPVRRVAERAAAPGAEPSEAPATAAVLGQGADQTVVVDGQRVVLQGARQVELRCGEASIVLTAAGKILIRGTYVLSRSRGANRIRGAFVDIN